MNFKDNAFKYKAIGFSVIPLKKNKRPYLGSWSEFQDRIAQDEEIVEWDKKWPTANIGIVTGEVSGLLALDIESKEGFAAAEAVLGEMPFTIVQNTGKPNGQHLLFKHPKNGKKYTNWAKKIKECDFRGDGGYIMAAPSIHPNGKVYAYPDINPLEQGLDELADCPPELLAICDEATTQASGQNGNVSSKNPEGWVNELLFYGCESGERNEKIAKLAGYYYQKFNWDETQVLSQVLVFNYEKCRPPLPRDEIEKTVKSIGKRHKISNIINPETNGLIGYGQLIKLVYPDGFIMYRFHLVEGDLQSESFELSSNELLTQRLFRLKHMDQTGIVMPLVKQAEWDEYINMLHKKVIINYCGLDESPISKVVEILEEEIHGTGVTDEYSLIKQRPCIVKGGSIKLTLKGLEDHFRNFGDYDFNRKDLVKHLRTLGFEDKQINRGIGLTQVRGWVMKLKDFKKGIAEMTKKARTEEDRTDEYIIKNEDSNIDKSTVPLH